MSTLAIDETHRTDTNRRGARRRDGTGCGRKHAFASRGFCRDRRRPISAASPQVASGVEAGSHDRIVGSLSYYDPTTGQFLSRDPITPLTRSAYGYTGGNPLNRRDPSGLYWGEDQVNAVGSAIDNGVRDFKDATGICGIYDQGGCGSFAETSSTGRAIQVGSAAYLVVFAVVGCTVITGGACLEGIVEATPMVSGWVLDGWLVGAGGSAAGGGWLANAHRNNPAATCDPVTGDPIPTLGPIESTGPFVPGQPPAPTPFPPPWTNTVPEGPTGPGSNN